MQTAGADMTPNDLDRKVREEALGSLYGWRLFLDIDETKVTESIDRLRETFNLTLGGAATLFYTRTTIEPARCMMGKS